MSTRSGINRRLSINTSKKHYPKLALAQWAAEKGKKALSKISEDNAVAKKLQQDLESYLLQTPTQTTKPSQDPPSSPPDATNRTTLGNLEPGCIDEGRSGLDTISQDQDREATLNRDSGRIEGGRNGFDTILQQEKEVRQPQTDPLPASSQSVPPLNGFTFPPQSLHHTNSQRISISTQAMSNLQQSRREFAIDANQQQGEREWHPGQQFSMNEVQEPNQSLNPNQSLGTAPAATIDSQLDSNTGLFVNFTQVDRGKATKRGKRQKLDNLSQDVTLHANAEQSSASTWQRIPVGQQGQAHLQAQSFNVQASLYSGSVSTPLIAFQQDFNAVPPMIGT